MNTLISRSIGAIMVLALSIGFAAQAQDEDAVTKSYNLTISPFVNYIDVDGNEQLFRAHNWMDDKLTGGLSLSYSTSDLVDGDLSIDAFTRLGNDEFEVDGEWVSADGLITIRAGVEQYRKYFDNAGWYYEENDEPYLNTASDFELDLGSVYFDIGFKLQENTELVLGYEYRFKHGSKSATQYNTVDGKKIWPGYKNVREETHIFKLDFYHQGDGWAVQDNMRYETYAGNTKRLLVLPADVAVDGIARGPEYNEQFDFDQFSNALTYERWLQEWLLMTAGYLYVHTRGEVGFNMSTLPGTGMRDYADFIEDSKLRQNTHLFNVGLMAGPWKDWLAIAGFEVETMERDATVTHFHGRAPADERVKADVYERKLGFKEELELRYSGIPRTRAYIRGTWRQERFYLDEYEILTDEPAPGNLEFERDTETDRDEERYRIGFTTSPISSISISTYYQRGKVNNENTHVTTSQPARYSAFIDRLDVDSEEFEVKLTVQHLRWLRTTWKYSVRAEDYHTKTQVEPGEKVFAANHDRASYSVAATVNPYARLYWTTMFTFQETRTTLDYLEDDLAPVYNGDVYSITTSVGYGVTNDTWLNVRYLYERADNQQTIVVEADGLDKSVAYQRHGLSLGVEHRFTDNLSGRVAYDYWHYNDENYGEAGQYKAHGLGLGMVYTF